MRNGSNVNERGAILYMALFALIPLAGLTFGLVRIATSFSSESRHRIEDEHALFLAEVGVEEAMLALQTGGSGAVGTAAAPVFFGDGLYWVESEPLGNDLIRLTSAAMYESGRAAVEQLVFRNYDSNLDTTVFSRRGLTLNSNVLVDSFDSNLGTYSSQLSGGVGGDGAIVESNSSIRLDSTTEVYGDVHPGKGNGVSMASNVDVTGTMQPLETDRDIPSVTVPALVSTGDRTVNGSINFASGDYAWDKFTIDGHPVIKGPARIVVKEFEVRSNASITFDTSTGPVEFYVLDKMKLASNSKIVTTSQSAKDMVLYYMGPAGTTADLRSNSAFYGRIVAPYGNVLVNSNFEVFGSIQADLILVDSNARIHYDRALLDISGTPTYARAAWSRTGFPDQNLLLNRRDPFQLLGVDRSTLALPGDAHGAP